MFPDHCHRRIEVASAADTGIARTVAAELADTLLAPAEAARLDAVVAALADHAMRQPAGGTMLLRRWGRRDGVECLLFDRTPAAGTADEPAAFTAACASADRFLSHITPGVGRAILARVLRAGCSDAPAPGAIAVMGAVMVAKAGTTGCGDGWFLRGGIASLDASGEVPACVCIESGIALVVDGVAGRGRDAATARRIEAVVAATVPGLSPQMVIGAIRRDFGNALDATAAVVRFDAESVDYTALGTVAGAVVRRNEITSLAARWAMVGYHPQVPASVHLLWCPGDHVVLHSDGCARLPGLFIERKLQGVDPTLAALVLLRDGTMQDDDRTIVVLRNVSVSAGEAIEHG